MGILNKFIRGVLAEAGVVKETMSTIVTLSEFEGISMEHDEEDEDDKPVTPDDFRVFMGGKVPMIQWHTYGPFNPQPEWAWDGSRWVDNDEEYDLYNQIMGH